MQKILSVETLKTGEALTIACVLAPDSVRGGQIRPFLAHKPPNYLGHIDAALKGDCDALETRFYIGLLNDEVVGNIMTVETDGVGILGHVHTRMDQRRKGICDAIMRHQMEDFRQRQGQVLLLGTGYQSAAYKIYEKHGFRDWTVGYPGAMRYDTQPEGEFESRIFEPGPTVSAQATWKHWPLVALLATVPAQTYLRSLTLGLWGVGLLEGAYSHFLTTHGRRAETQARVLEAETGAVVALATCVPDSRFPGIELLDLFAHPNVAVEPLVNLLESMSLLSGHVQCYADSRDTQKIRALECLGFERIAVLPRQFQQGEAWRALWLYARPEGVS